MREMLYVLDGHEPVEVTDPVEWGRWFESSDDARRVAFDDLGTHCVSTVFLGVNYNYMPGGVPILFETMVFSRSGLKNVEETRRYATWREAEVGHAMIVDLLKTVEAAT